MTAKFSPLNAALSAAGLGQIPVEKPVIGHVGSTDAGCALVLMNSCWGCGAVEYIPAECYWSDLLRECGQHFQSDVDEQLQECVELLMADQSIAVENYDARPDSWILEARI